MADSSSRLFNPGAGARVPDSDPMVQRVPLDMMPHGARKSQLGGKWDNGDLAVKHVPNSR